MNTNTIKSFAKQARLLLLDGVSQRLKYWGFNQEGTNLENLESTTGGYIFREKVYTDVTVPPKWNNLKKRLTSKQAVNDVVEQAAYTWFNRLMAIKILEENRYIGEQLAYTSGLRTPMIVQNAKHGRHELVRKSDKELLLEYLQEDKEELAFGLLITNLCNRNNLLHDIFGRIDDFTEILLPQNLLQKDGLLDLINSNAIADPDYKEVELIGWLYQFYISEKKDEIFAGLKKNKKARAEDIPAATQIFTPKWIVKYMVENTVGKIYLDYEPGSTLKGEMKYLVENENDSNQKPIISDIKELTLIDPACGSGHILVTGFDLLFKMYREQGYTARQAVESILKHNLYGLDIDDRAMQLARFAVLLKAEQYDAEVLNKGIIPHIYSFPEANFFTTEELQNFLGYEGHQHTAELKGVLTILNQGKNIGSVLKVSLSEEASNIIKIRYTLWLNKNKTSELDIEQTSIWNRLRPFLDVILVLTNQYTTVIANPPYMGQKGMNNNLKNYVDQKFPDSKEDLYSVFQDVMIKSCLKKGRIGIVTMDTWMFKDAWKIQRKKIINTLYIESLLHFGWHVMGIAFDTCSYIFIKNMKVNQNSFFNVINKEDIDSISHEPIIFPNSKRLIAHICQNQFLKIKDQPIAYWISKKTLIHFNNDLLVGQKFNVKQGIKTGNNNLFIKYWWEINFYKGSIGKGEKWIPCNKGGEYRKWYGNNYFFLEWGKNGEKIRNYYDEKGKLKSRPQNIEYFFREGITWSTASSSDMSFRFFQEGYGYESSGSCIFYQDKFEIKYLLTILNSKIGQHFVNFLRSGRGYSEGSIKRIPFIPNTSNYSTELGEKQITLSKKDWDSRETSWDFEKSPLLNESTSLSQAYKHWQEQVTQDVFQLHTNEEELNRIFIEIYGLQEELTPEVALKDITILQEELDRNALERLEPVFREKGKDAVELPIDKAEVISQFLSYCIGIILGRYRLDKTGLNIAHPNPSEDELASYSYDGHKIVIDEDAILPIMGENCAFPDDALLQIKKIILAIWGEDTLTENLNFLQNECLGMNLHNWLNERFWNYHTGMYKKKPIYWLFSSNPEKPNKAAFKVLAYMHRMDKYSVQRIQRNYLHPHQEYIQGEIKKLRENEDSLSRNEQKRLDMFENWKTECIEYNEVLKELANQQIEFDLDDGVSVNYAKFEGAVANI
jgi:hypothetical protein